MSKTSENLPEGWGNPTPFSARSKFHYFQINNVSLCGKWSNACGLIDLEDDKDDHEDNCAACRRKIVAHRTRQIKAKQ